MDMSELRKLKRDLDIFLMENGVEYPITRLDILEILKENGIEII